MVAERAGVGAAIAVFDTHRVAPATTRGDALAVIRARGFGATFAAIEHAVLACLKPGTDVVAAKRRACPAIGGAARARFFHGALPISAFAAWAAVLGTSAAGFERFLAGRVTADRGAMAACGAGVGAAISGLNT